jgi:ribonuclease D
MTDEDSWVWVDQAEGLLEVARALRGADYVAVDTESDSMHSYFEKVCLIQIATADRAFLVDPLALNGELAPLAKPFADPRITKIFHGADYDIVCLKRDFGFDIRGIFDTMVAAQCLDIAKFGLADLVGQFFGDILEKKHSRTDWARRPLTDSELLYSYLDVKYLIEMTRILEDRLAKADVFEEAVVEFRRLEDREQAPRVFDPDGYLRIRGSRDLTDVQRSVLRELFSARDRQSRRLDRPPFKVLANDTLLRIALASPTARNALAAVKGVTKFVLQRQGDQILKAVRRGRERGRPPEPGRKQSRGVRLNPRKQRQLERLKDWRKTESTSRGVPTLVVLPNHAIQEIVVTGPTTVEALAELATVGEKRARIYGSVILKMLGSRS